MATFQVGVPPNDPEVMHAEMRREQEDVRWIEDNMGRCWHVGKRMAALVEEYGIKFVAVRHRQVIGASPRLTELLRDLEEQGVDPGLASIEVLSRQE